MVKEKSGAKVLLFYETQVAMRKYIVSFPQNAAKNSLLVILLPFCGGGGDRFSQTPWVCSPLY